MTTSPAIKELLALKRWVDERRSEEVAMLQSISFAGLYPWAVGMSDVSVEISRRIDRLTKAKKKRKAKK